MLPTIPPMGLSHLANCIGSSCPASSTCFPPRHHYHCLAMHCCYFYHCNCLPLSVGCLASISQHLLQVFLKLLSFYQKLVLTNRCSNPSLLPGFIFSPGFMYLVWTASLPGTDCCPLFEVFASCSHLYWTNTCIVRHYTASFDKNISLVTCTGGNNIN
jgi:hypothetical protein